ncbi:hypothetical protein KKB40_05465, partial [Patescibacteria group bacterium]|nr:hypothetical protein [Patescibacteria group bacterium]
EQVTARQLWAELVMRSHWKGWQEDDVARGGTTFEEYMELVKQGGGKYMVSGTIDDTSLSFRERDVIQELEVDPQLPITVVLSNRADPLVSFVPESGFRIAQKLNREMIIEYTFKESVRGKYYEDPFMLGYYADAKASGAMQSLSFPPEMQAKNTGLIGGEIAFDPDLRDFTMMPQAEIQLPILKAITN